MLSIDFIPKEEKSPLHAVWAACGCPVKLGRKKGSTADNFKVICLHFQAAAGRQIS